ncbi:MAG: hypothetical protein Q9166_002516 [cf. Caloplaca sp. 2 TL-2023]
MQHHGSYNSNTINQYPPQQQYGQNTPVSSPPITHDNPKQEYYPGQEHNPTPVHPQQIMSAQQTPARAQGYQTAIPLANLQNFAVPVDCPVCHMRALTKTEYHSGDTTNVWAALVCICCCLGCIPYLIRNLKDVEHKCGHCSVLLATWHNSGRVVVHQHH